MRSKSSLTWTLIPLQIALRHQRPHNAKKRYVHATLARLDSVDVHPGPFVELVAQLFLLAFILANQPWVDSHLREGACSAAFG